MAVALNGFTVYLKQLHEQPTVNQHQVPMIKGIEPKPWLVDV